MVSGIVVAAILVAIVASGGSERRESSLPPPSNATPELAPTPPPSISPQEAAARGALAKALRFAVENPNDLGSQRSRFAEAVDRAAGTPLLGDARRELDRVDRKLAELRAAELAKAQPAPALEVKAPAPPPPPPAPKPAPAPAPERPPEVSSRQARWELALAPSTGRDYSSSLAALEKLGEAALDIQLVRSAMALHHEAVQALARTPKGQKVALEYRDAGGELRRAEAAFVGEQDARVELRTETGTVDIEIGEILPSSLVDHLRSHGGSIDLPAAAVFCLLEGDEPGARRLLADRAESIPVRFWSYARSVLESERAADSSRGLYQEALALANNFSTAADAAPRYQALLRDHAESPFVRRNRTSLTARAQQCGRDFLYVAADLQGSGSFKAGKSSKGHSCWTSDADSDEAKLKDNFLELSFSVLPETTYKCWIYAGACCQETFEFWVQGTEMMGPTAKGGKEYMEPGSGLATMVKPWVSTLKKTHASHLGPKQPSHWEWVPIPLPKYAKPGLQRVRFLTNQKGFSIAYACVSANRSSPPRESDLRDLEKSRGERAMPVAGPRTKAMVLYTLDFDKSPPRLVGESRDRALYGRTLYNSCLAGVEGNPVFTLPAQGELRITYLLRTITPLSARLRIVRGDKTVPYDASVSQPVAGRPAEIRIPLSDFRPAHETPGPALATGDIAVCVYFSGQDIACGLRIDALSLVELRPNPAAKAALPKTGKLLFSENFENGCGKFQGGELVEGGVNGSRALSLSLKPVNAWGAWSVPVKDSVVISFRLKPLVDVSRVEVLVWSEALHDNARYYVEGLKKGEWQDVRFNAVDLRIGWARDGPGIPLVDNITFHFRHASADARILLDDFEIRE